MVENRGMGRGKKIRGKRREGWRRREEEMVIGRRRVARRKERK